MTCGKCNPPRQIAPGELGAHLAMHEDGEPTWQLGFDDYQAEAMRTAPGPHDEKQLAVFALGVAGEAGEVAELIKKHIGHGHLLDREKLCKELGDVAWYVAVLAQVCGIPLSEVASKNVAKLRARYPEGFSEQASQNRKPGDQ